MIRLQPLGVDDWSRPVYKDEYGNKYLDINLGEGEPSIHTMTEQGEPESPITNYIILES